MVDYRERLFIQVVTAVSLILMVICMLTGGVVALVGFVGLSTTTIIKGLVFYAVGLLCLRVAGWEKALARLWGEENE